MQGYKLLLNMQSDGILQALIQAAYSFEQVATTQNKISHELRPGTHSLGILKYSANLGLVIISVLKNAVKQAFNICHFPVFYYI